MPAHLHLAPAQAQGSRSVDHAQPIRVVLAAEHAALRGGLRALLECEGNFEVIAEADALESRTSGPWSGEADVIVLDRSISGGSSIATIDELRERAPRTQVVVLTAEDRPAFVQRALVAGAIGLVAKDAAAEELAQAVSAAARGERFISPRLAARLDALRRSLTEERLTPREAEVLGLIALGHTSVEIAHKLRLSPRTIETHRAHIHSKLGLENRAELVRYALRRGLIGP